MPQWPAPHPLTAALSGPSASHSSSITMLRKCCRTLRLTNGANKTSQATVQADIFKPTKFGGKKSFLDLWALLGALQAFLGLSGTLESI